MIAACHRQRSEVALFWGPNPQNGAQERIGDRSVKLQQKQGLTSVSSLTLVPLDCAHVDLTLNAIPHALLGNETAPERA
ncbi:protein of unknown function [Bradyrhizobium vignae]|uniref:Uncharacterized protein n=1 Tax=Bradyrhizobium vignae TaxID=1549949 RepID=A0A2U3PVG4_9BRAD|nr:protein of unknown function [Bradyrhizobium vignae]